MSDHVIVCGFGHVGYRVSRLLRRLGLDVVVLYDQAPAEWIREVETDGCRCLQGDARSNTLLEAAGVAEARALLAATDRDLVNLSIALDARRLNPRLVLVVRLFDQDLAPHIRRILDVRGPFSTTAVAAPVFLAAALGENVVECFSIDGKPWVVAESGTTDGSETSDGVPFLRALGRGVRVAAAGDRTPPAAATLVLRPSAAPAARVGRRRPAGPRGPLHDALGRVPAGLRGVLLTLLAVTLLSVFVFHFGLRLSLIDALYFVTTTITTVGYGDISLLAAPAGLKLYGVLLMLCGAALLATLFGIVTDLVVSARLREVVAGGRRPTRPHVVVAGCGHIGQRVVAALRAAGEEVVAIVPDRTDPACRGWGREVLVVEGDPRQRDTLERAALGDARAFMALGEDDIVNLGATLQAKELNPGLRTVARVFDSMLAAKLGEQLRIDRVFSISAVAAPMLAAACLLAGVVEAFVWRGHLVVVRREAGGTAAAAGGVGLEPLRVADRGRFAVRAVEGGSGIAPLAEGETAPDMLEVFVLPLLAADGAPARG